METIRIYGSALQKDASPPVVRDLFRRLSIIIALLVAYLPLAGCAALWETPTPSAATTTPDVRIEKTHTGTPTRAALMIPAASPTIPPASSAALVFGDEPLQSWADPNDVNGLLHDGRSLWATTAGGVVRWDPASGRYTTYGPQDGLATQNTRGIARDADGHVWVAYADHGAWSEYDGTAWHTFPSRQEAVEARYAAMLGAMRSDPRLWNEGVAAGTDTPWLWLPAADGRVQAYDGKQWRTYGEKEGVTRNTWLVVVDTTGNVWALGDGISTAEQGDRLWTDHSLLVGVEANSRVTDIVADGAGGVWLSFAGPGRLGGAVTRMEAATERWTSHRYSLNQAIPRQVYGLDIDAESTLWVWGEGAIAFRRPDQRWQHIALPNMQAQAVVRDAQGSFWIGTDRGIWSAAPDGQNIQGPWLVPAPPISGRVEALAVYGQKVIIGTARGVSYVDALTGDTGPLMALTPLALAVVGGGSGAASQAQLAVGTRAGLYVTEGEQEPRLVSQDPVAVLTVDSAGVLWGATEDGRLGRLDPQGWQNVAQVGTNLGGAVKDLAVAADGTAWFATPVGLGMLSPQGEFTHFGIDEGLPDADIRALALVPDGPLWVGTARGLMRRAANGNWSRLTVQSTDGGLLSEEVWDLWVDGAGNVWFATTGGISRRTEEAKWAYYEVTGIRTLRPGPGETLWMGGLNGLYRLRTNALVPVPG
jgi:ligand-binding sensor domain-containing protein